MANVLIVEDEDKIARLIATALMISGHCVRIASALPDALDIIWEGWPEVVTLDLNLRGQDGSQVLFSARQMRSPAKFLIISAQGAEVAGNRLRAEGWINKPFDPAYVTRQVDNLVGLEPQVDPG